ncbi:MAG: Epsin-3, clathrin recruitment and traffic between the Golgi and endosome [Alyxoria varia]|nr:MAG: Epsin-3, clathrin recruitment and traffic between the Golgi and endosome [Alyxoria varia]
MDLDNIKSQVSNLTLYDVKYGFRKAQNAVMNYTEMEAKVREATNNNPWGASSSEMQEIANGTFNYATLNEVMPMIYKRFTEKTAEEWRQIYKALQLLEFLIKHGSERVIDDARSHLSLLRMLRQFHYIDQNGKDQGINVRNRAKELAELLSNVDTIRTERKKARTTRNKYGGYEGGMGLSSGMSEPRHGGFGAESGGGYGGYSGGVYGDGGGFGGRSGAEEYNESSQGRRDRFEEYDEYDDGGAASSGIRREGSAARTAPTKQAAKPKEPEVDLFDFGDDDIAPTSAISTAPTSNGKQPPAASNDFDALQGSAGAGDNDDFDDFQSATPSTTTQNTGTNKTSNNLFAAISPPPSTTASSQISTPPIQAAMQAQQRQPAQSTIPQIPQPGQQKQPNPAAGPNYGAFNIGPPPNVTSPPLTSPSAQQSSPANRPQPSGYQAAQPNYFGSVALSSSASGTSTPASGVSKPMSQQLSGGAASQQKKPATASSGDPFATLAGGAQGKKNQSAQRGPTMADMAKQKASAGIWGANAPAQQQQGGGAGGSSGGDLI